VFFQTLAERLGFDRLAAGMSAFGLGEITGIGLPERPGLLPRKPAKTSDPLGALWSSGIGQGHVAATPLQMANVAATIARGGIWMRPKLLEDESGPLNRFQSKRPSTRPAVVDLELSPQSVALAQQGMWEVVHDVGGTGKALDFPSACGKTGTAQAAAMMVPFDDKGNPTPILGTDGKPMKDERGRIQYQMQPLRPSTEQDPNPAAPWYLGSGNSGTDLAHAWYIGFAPHEHPRIAFCVMIEYGGSGGTTAAVVARQVLEACVEQGYLPK
jgi:penicillin-binding protein 2